MHKILCQAWSVRSRTSIAHVHTNCVVMWETLPNNVDWDCFKTLILQETTQNQRQEEFCVFSEVTHLCQEVGVQGFDWTQFYWSWNHISMQVLAWTVFTFSLSRIWWVKYFIRDQTEKMDPREEPNMHNSIPIKPNERWSHSTISNAFWFQCCVGISLRTMCKQTRWLI